MSELAPLVIREKGSDREREREEDRRKERERENNCKGGLHVSRDPRDENYTQQILLEIPALQVV